MTTASSTDASAMSAAATTGSAGGPSVAQTTGGDGHKGNPTDGDDAGTVDPQTAPPTKMQQTTPMQVDAGSVTVPNTEQCGRNELQQHAEAYLMAMASGSTQSLSLHPALRYTENGTDQPLGAGIWLDQPQPVYAWHALDEQQCSSATEAVLRALGGDIIYAVRLRYAQKQLIDVEAMVVVRQLRNLFDPAAIIQTGTDPWTKPLPLDKRAERDALVRVAQRFLEAAIVPSTAPPAADGCRLRQNGVITGLNGNCVLPEDGDRFMEARYPVVDLSTGVVAAIGRRRSFLIMVFAKIEEDTLYNVDAVGGMAVTKTGW